MVKSLLTALVLGLTASAAVGAGTTRDIGWADLLPDGAQQSAISGIVQHNQAASARALPQSTGVRQDLNGQSVRVSGFVVPLDYDGSWVSTFMLVPFVGACVHVPPPPPNQLILVTARKPFKSGGMFEPVTVEGVLSAATTSTDLADVGYSLTTAIVRPYE